MGTFAKMKCTLLVSVALAVVLVFFVVMLLGANAKKRDSKHFDYLTQVGIAMRTAEATCLSIANPSLRMRSRVFLVNTSSPQTIAQAEIVRKQQNPCTQADGSGVPFDSYQLRATGRPMQGGPPGIAIYGFNGEFAKRGASVVADLDGDGRLEFFRSCTSQEGVHFTIWSDEPLKGKRRWHRYIYLGYGVEPTCSNSETELDPPQNLQ
jgi:hypothetical protein